MRRVGPLAILFVALVLGAARCPPPATPDAGTPEPAPEPEEDAGAPPIDAGDPEPDPEPSVDAGECIPDPGGLPSPADSLAYFTGTGISEHLTACAQCHFGGQPTAEAVGWGPGGPQNEENWFNAAIGTYGNDVNDNAAVTPQGTDLYRTTNQDHQGQVANPTVAAEVVDWIEYATTVSPPVICPDPDPEPPIDAGNPEPPDAGEPIDAGQPEVDAGPGEPGVVSALLFSTNNFTIPRDTCVPTPSNIRLIDSEGTVVDNDTGLIIDVRLRGYVGEPGNLVEACSFHRDVGCLPTDLTDRVTFNPGDSSKVFRWKCSVSGPMVLQGIPTLSSGIPTQTQDHVITD